ncbi:unnamed protein product, partial [Cylicostephanus goldi]
MASVPPGDINTQPNSKIVFNAPYDDKHTYHIKIINASGRRIGWAMKTTNIRRLGVDLHAGCLIPKSCAYGSFLRCFRLRPVRIPTTAVSQLN